MFCLGGMRRRLSTQGATAPRPGSPDVHSSRQGRMTSGVAQAFNSPYVQFYPTVRCNLECSFCFNRGLSAFEDVRVDDFRRIVSILHTEGIRWVDFLGGEPTLHAYLVTLLKVLRDGEMGCNLSTNGTGIEILRFLSKKFDKEFLRVGVSLHETRLSADLHDYIITHRPVLKSVMGGEDRTSEGLRGVC